MSRSTPAPPRCEPLPPKPVLELKEFTEPRPSFTSDVHYIDKKAYTFGIDDSIFVKRYPYEESVWLSDPIETEFYKRIKLGVIDLQQRHSSIEYNIVTANNNIIPILPQDKKYVFNELIRPHQPLRFNIDRDKPYKIFEKSKTEELKNKSIEDINEPMKYTIEYYPQDIKRATVLELEDEMNIRILVKLIILDKQKQEPYVERMYLMGDEGRITWRQII